MSTTPTDQPTDQPTAPTADDRRRELLQMLDQLSPAAQSEIAALCTALLDSQAGRLSDRETVTLRAALDRARALTYTVPVNHWLRRHGYLKSADAQ